MKYYKVVNNLTSEIIIDTSNVNYNSTLSNYADFLPLITFVTDSSKFNDMPLDFYITLNNQLANFGDLYIQHIQQVPKSNSDIFKIFDITKNPNHQNITIKENRLVEIIENIIGIGPSIFEQGFYLWEHIFDQVRLENHKLKPKRYDSFFLFENLDACKYYIDKHKGGGQICEIELIATKAIFKADMSMIDDIPNYYTIKQAEEVATKYWLGEESKKPVYEILFQGLCKMKPLN